MVSYGKGLKEKNVASSDLVPTTRTLQPTTAPMGTATKGYVYTKSSYMRSNRHLEKRGYIFDKIAMFLKLRKEANIL